MNCQFAEAANVRLFWYLGMQTERAARRAAEARLAEAIAARTALQARCR